MFQRSHSQTKAAISELSKYESPYGPFNGLILKMRQSFNVEKGFGFIVERKGGDEYLLRKLHHQ